MTIWFHYRQVFGRCFFNEQGGYLHINICIKQRRYYRHFLPVRHDHQMKIIGLIHEPKVMEGILCDLGLWKQDSAPQQSRPKS